MDIHAGILATALLTLLGAFLCVRGAIRTIQSARRLTFYRLRRERTAGGWRLFGLAILLVALAGWLAFYAEPVVYQYFPPSPTPSLTPRPTTIPTITETPTITLTPTITDTPAVTNTPTITTTPALPPAIEALFQSTITPNPDAVFSPLEFSTQFDGLQAVSPKTVFQNPIRHMYGVFTYDKMVPGSQWTALWFREGGLVHYETKPWDGATGGYGFTDWYPPQEQWLPGRYEVQIFVGQDWKVIGEFILQGNPPTATLTRTPTFTVTPTFTRTPSATPTPSRTPLPSATLRATSTALIRTP